MQLDTAKGDLLQAQSTRSSIDRLTSCHKGTAIKLLDTNNVILTAYCDACYSSRREKGDDEWQQLCDKQSAELRQLRDDNQNLTGQLSAHHITIGRLESEVCDTNQFFYFRLHKFSLLILNGFQYSNFTLL
jgi:hypothetical protein